MDTQLAGGRLEWTVRLFVPQALTFLLFLLNLTSFSFPVLGPLKPAFVLMAIYYWAIFRPTLIPPLAAFITGLLMDFLTGLPPGLNAFVLVAVQWVVRDQRRYLMGQTFGVVWLGFILICVAAGLTQWGIFGLLQFHWPPLVPVLAEIGLSVFLFPLVVLMLLAGHRMLPAVASKAYS